MPVDLDAIPDVAAKVPRPRTSRWLIFGVIVLLAGGVTTLWFWHGEREGIVFWFTAVGLPVTVWGLLFSLRRFSYKCDQVWAQAWDTERQHIIEDETRRGQRHLWLLNSVVETSVGEGVGVLAKAVKSSSPLMTSSLPRSGKTTVRHTRLTEFDVAIDKTLTLDAKMALSASQFNDVINKLPADMPCYLAVDCQSFIPDTQTSVLERLTASLHRPVRSFSGSGFALLDSWLDSVWEVPAALLVVSVVLRDAPLDGEGEAIISQVFTNRPLSDFPDAVYLHRPEKGSHTTMAKILSRALLWAAVSPAAVKALWLSGETLQTDGALNEASAQGGLTLNPKDDCLVINQVIGDTGVAAPWIAAALAAWQAEKANAVQALVVQTQDDIWMAGVTPATIGRDIQDTQQ
jgi:hypothetical protein